MNSRDESMKSPDKGWWYATSGAAVGKVSEKWDSTGAVVQYGYDANGRQIPVPASIPRRFVTRFSNKFWEGS
jgi:hypothetical protein